MVGNNVLKPHFLRYKLAFGPFEPSFAFPGGPEKAAIYILFPEGT